MARDLMGECNDRRQPVAEFSQTWCSRCIRPDCGRSLHANLSFTQRTATWEERLFTQVKRLPMADPRQAAIAGQRFIPIEVGLTPDIRTSWVSPNEVPTQVDRPAAPEKKPIDPVDPNEKRRAPLAVEGEAPKGFRGGGEAINLLRTNVPSQGGRVLTGAPTTRPTIDPWAAPLPPDQPTVSPGARIRLGGVEKGAGETKP